MFKHRIQKRTTQRKLKKKTSHKRMLVLPSVWSVPSCIVVIRYSVHTILNCKKICNTKRHDKTHQINYMQNKKNMFCFVFSITKYVLVDYFESLTGKYFLDFQNEMFHKFRGNCEILHSNAMFNEIDLDSSWERCGTTREIRTQKRTHTFTRSLCFVAVSPLYRRCIATLNSIDWMCARVTSRKCVALNKCLQMS